jgi:hypothetical protein|eukprot:COSAG01_NODE_2481_length_7603_cov_4.629398_5_plen_39_part_00
MRVETLQLSQTGGPLGLSMHKESLGWTAANLFSLDNMV